MQLEYEKLSMQERLIYKALKTVIDPEIGESVIDLGLIYGIEVVDNRVNVIFTMTSLSCPMSEMLVDDISGAIEKVVPEGGEFILTLASDPPWDPSLISLEAKERLGWDE